MKQLLNFLFVILLWLIACQQATPLEPIPTMMQEEDECAAYIPFYEQADSSAGSVRVSCDCQDSTINLSARLAPYTQVKRLIFSCELEQFNQLPEMSSVTHLISEVNSANILAFPNLEVLENKVYLETPLSQQILFLAKLRELDLYNASNIPTAIRVRPFEVFRLTYQSTASQNVQLPNNLHRLQNLKELVIRNINTALFSDFEGLTSLEVLKISQTLWGRIPQTASLWPKLKSLEVSAVNIRGNLPLGIQAMDSLESIYISETDISSVSFQNICGAPNLKELTLSFCELEAIPEALGQLTSLEKLIISTEQNTINEAIALPVSIEQLVNLKSIHISTNTEGFPLALLKLKNSLESLSIKDEIGSVPAEIGDFVALKSLTLNHCGLVDLPPEIEKLAPKLEKLSLTGNDFSEAAQAEIKALLPDTQIYF